MDKIYTIAIIGCGSRGCNAYGNAAFSRQDKFKIIAICDIDAEKIKITKEKFNILDKNCFLNPDEFFKEKRADILIIATQDRDHVQMGIKAIKLGYNVLMEKPISPIQNELAELLDVSKKCDRKVMVCHVLRYAPAFIKVKSLIDEGKIGKLIKIESIEQVCYWHQAHSFVRGNWRNSSETSPMILAKCCHDLDLMQYYADSQCDTIYSVGELSYFNVANQPAGASDKCDSCKYIKTCPYSAEKIYLDLWEKSNSPTAWPWDVISNARPLTKDALRTAYQTGPYGRCVFKCDNDVVDNQMVQMEFKNGVHATLNMVGFTSDMGRKMTFHGTHGEVELNESEGKLRISIFGEESKYMSMQDIIDENDKDAFGHGGGDSKLLDALYDMAEGKDDMSTTLEKSIESHLMAFAAEKSRQEKKIVKVHV